jgi:hypothetical protein
MTTLDSIVKVSDDVIYQELDGEAILLDMQSEVFFGLDAVGTDIWKLLKTHAHVKTVARILTDHYQAGEDDLEEALLDFIEKLQAKGLVEIAR